LNPTEGGNEWQCQAGTPPLAKKGVSLVDKQNGLFLQYANNDNNYVAYNFHLGAHG